MNAGPTEDDLVTIRNKQRLTTVQKFTEKEDRYAPEFERLMEMVALEFGSQSVFINIVEGDREWQQYALSDIDIGAKLEHSFGALAISEPKSQPLVIRDTLQDERLNNNPLVTGSTSIRFYAAAPISMLGEKIGVLCVTDTKPRKDVTEKQISTLQKLAALADPLLQLVDISREKSISDLKYEREIERHRQSLVASKVVSWIWDLETDAVDCDEDLRVLFEIKHENRLTAKEILEQIDVEDQQDVANSLEIAFKKGEEFNAEFRIKDTNKWVLGQGRVLEWSDDGQPLSIAGINIDISKQKHSEEKTELLLRELNHRVKNTLAMLQSIANQTLKNSRSPEEFKAAFSGRIRSIAAAHTLLSDKEWEPIDLQKLIQDQVFVYVGNNVHQLKFNGRDVTLGPEESLALGMVLHELTTNAVKYGALSTPNGFVSIDVEVDVKDDVSMLHLDWTEVDGPEVVPPEKNGFGSIMIKRSLDKIIGSHVDLMFNKNGVRAEIKMPISAQN